MNILTLPIILMKRLLDQLATKDGDIVQEEELLATVDARVDKLICIFKNSILEEKLRQFVLNDCTKILKKSAGEIKS